MNSTLLQAARRILHPAINASQGVEGTYSRDGREWSLVMVPSSPDFVQQLDNGSIEQWQGIVWTVTQDQWALTRLPVPVKGDRWTVTLGDNVTHIFSVLPPGGKQEYDQAPQGESFRINMKRVKS